MKLRIAFRMYPNLKRYIIITDKSSTSFKKVLRNSTASRVKVLQLLDGSYLHPVSKAGTSSVAVAVISDVIGCWLLC